MVSASRTEFRSVRRYRKAVVAVAVSGGIVFLLSKLPRVPDGVPSEPPDESRRIMHATGLSIVAPPDWSASPMTSLLRIYPSQTRTGPTRRLRAGILVMPIGPRRPADLQPPRFGRFREIQFQDRPAWERMEVVRESTFDDPAHSGYTLYFQRNGEWYVITYFIAEKRTELPPEVLEYNNTFRLERVDGANDAG